jgi:Ca-activated chloride channel family protein
MRRYGAALLLAALCVGARASEDEPALGPAGADEPALAIVEPGEDAFVSGPITLRARVAPASARILRIAFSADGQPVCSREAPPFECEWDAGPTVVPHQVRVVASLRDGGRLVATVRTKGAAFAPAVEVQLVQVATTVTDKSGRFVRGLGRDAFRIFEDGVEQPLTHFIGEDTARELVIAVDISGSMAEAMPACRQAVKGFLATLRPDDQVTLLAFNDNIFTLARRETDAAARAGAVDRLAPWGGTALHDVVLRGLDLLDQKRGRRALVVFSDGEDRSSHATAQDVERRVEVTNAPIYVIAQGRGTRERSLKQGLDRLADVSGGRSFYTDKIDELGGVFTEITADLASQYLLAYDPLKAERDGSWRAIRVEVAGKHRVRARQGYRAVALR